MPAQRRLPPAAPPELAALEAIAPESATARRKRRPRRHHAWGMARPGAAVTRRE